MPNDEDDLQAGDAVTGPTLFVTSKGMAKASGSNSLAFQKELIDQVTSTLWKPEWKSTEQKMQAANAAYRALQQIAPRDELEGMLSAQMISTHNAAMECLRRAMMEDQTFEGRDQNLKHAAKLLQIYTRQLEALDKHRGKGRQKITVEHVNVHPGGQAIVGDVHTGADKSNEAQGQPKRQTAPAALEDQSDADHLGRGIMDDLARETTTSKRRRKR